MSHSWLPSRMVRFWLSIFWRADWSILASCMSSSSRILRVSNRIVLLSSTKSTCGSSASASLTTWAILFTLSRLSLTVPHEHGQWNFETKEYHSSPHRLVATHLRLPLPFPTRDESFNFAVVTHFNE